MQEGLLHPGSTNAYNFENEEFLKNCEYFFPDPIEISPNTKIEVNSLLKYKLRI